jgi:hypothetical protein
MSRHRPVALRLVFRLHRPVALRLVFRLRRPTASLRPVSPRCPAARLRPREAGRSPPSPPHRPSLRQPLRWDTRPRREADRRDRKGKSALEIPRGEPNWKSRGGTSAARTICPPGAALKAGVSPTQCPCRLSNMDEEETGQRIPLAPDASTPTRANPPARLTSSLRCEARGTPQSAASGALADKFFSRTLSGSGRRRCHINK